MAKGPTEGGWGWKKISLFLGLIILVIAGPWIAISNWAFEGYLVYSAEHKGDDFAKWLHMKVGSISSKTMRPALSAKAYKQYVDLYHNPDDPSQDDEATYTAWMRYGEETANDHHRVESLTILQEWFDTYGEGHPFYGTVKETYQMIQIRPN